MTSTEPLDQFLAHSAHHFTENTLVKLVLSKYRGKETELQRITIRPVAIKNQPMLCFVYQYKTQDITKNHALNDALALLNTLLSADFRNAHLFTAEQEFQLEFTKKGKAMLHENKSSTAFKISTEHNREKHRFIDTDRPYLHALGITDAKQNIIPSMSHKWKQINKFIEVLSQAMSECGLTTQQSMQVVDFGSGKGYLTFALHDYLHNSLHQDAVVCGVELRENLVSFCNKTTDALEKKGLQFICGDVKTHAPASTDIMIALHACDTATDYAIHYGIRTNASIIMCSPCCHKQIRPQLQSPSTLKPMLQYGVHLNQEAEMVTDSLRALLLEANGYSTKVFEFISLEHTNKNKMILATKHSKPNNRQEELDQIEKIKAFYGIKEHCLETLLKNE